ncbi:hypothetical protein ABBQ38_006164 [Trebouxia sp. C0009 RCD-2024]
MVGLSQSSSSFLASCSLSKVRSSGCLLLRVLMLQTVKPATQQDYCCNKGPRQQPAALLAVGELKRPKQHRHGHESSVQILAEVVAESVPGRSLTAISTKHSAVEAAVQDQYRVRKQLCCELLRPAAEIGKLPDVEDWRLQLLLGRHQLWLRQCGGGWADRLWRPPVLI